MLICSQDCDECIKLDPNFGMKSLHIENNIISRNSSNYLLVKGYTRKGACHFAMKEFSKAIDAYNKALEIDKDNKVT